MCHWSFYFAALVSLSACVGGHPNGVSNPGSETVGDKGTSEGVGLPGYDLDPNKLVLNVVHSSGEATQVTISGSAGSVSLTSTNAANGGALLARKSESANTSSDNPVVDFWFVPSSDWPQAENNSLQVTRSPDATVTPNADGSFPATVLQFVSDPNNPTAVLMMPVAAHSNSGQTVTLPLAAANSSGTTTPAPDLEISVGTSGASVGGVSQTGPTAQTATTTAP